MATQSELDTAVRGKLAAEHVGDLTEETMALVFEPVVCPTMCMESARRQVANGLTVAALYTEFPAASFVEF